MTHPVFPLPGSIAPDPKFDRLWNAANGALPSLGATPEAGELRAAISCYGEDYDLERLCKAAAAVLPQLELGAAELRAALTPFMVLQ